MRDARRERMRDEYERAAYERGLRRGLAIAREAEVPGMVAPKYVVAVVDWDAALKQMEREIEEAKR